MLVTFKTNAYSDITLFGSVAVSLLKMMGQSGKVPGAIMAEDIPEAITQLQEGLEKLEPTSSSGKQANESDVGGFDDDDESETIGLDKRAGPLISLLEAAVAANENVMWSISSA